MLLQKDPALYLKGSEVDAQIAENAAALYKKSAGVRIIPVVFHIFHTNGPENISREQILDQIRILNEDFRNKNSNKGNTRSVFQNLVTDAEIEFRLAKTDPNGNCTDGIVRQYNTLTENGDDEVKYYSFWNSKKYLNIWVVKNIISDPGSVTLGYAQFPGWGAEETDGIIVRSDQIGSIGTASFPSTGKNGMGRTCTHEIGHWLGLFHTFQSGCSGGDQVGDTPPTSASASGCFNANTSKNTCSNDVPNMVDMLENYMDYTDGACVTMFTIGQKARIDGVLNSSSGFRRLLTSSSNLDATGIAKPVPNAAVLDLPFMEGAETIDLSSSTWQVFSNGGESFTTTPSASSAGSKSFFFNNYNSSILNQRDELMSPAINFNISDPGLHFRWAYAQKVDLNNDTLKVYVSRECGHNWELKFEKSGADLASAPIAFNEFYPTTNAEWRNWMIPLRELEGEKNVRIMFHFMSRKGNNLFIDDINITNSTGIESLNQNELSDMNIYPNPFTNTATLNYSLPEQGNVNVYVTDILGKDIMPVFSGNQNSGNQSLEINTASLGIKAGIYFVTVKTNEGITTKKFMVTQ